jgi:hypothetical protein
MASFCDGLEDQLSKKDTQEAVVHTIGLEHMSLDEVRGLDPFRFVLYQFYQS